MSSTVFASEDGTSDFERGLASASLGASGLAGRPFPSRPGSARRWSETYADGRTRYHLGEFHVDVEKDGTIYVRQDDWLSKYTLAIDGTLQVAGKFVRERAGVVLPIEHIDIIRRGEQLVHVETRLAYLQALESEHIQQETRPINPADLPRPDDTAGQLGPEYRGTNLVDDVFTGLNILDTLATIVGTFRQLPPVLARFSGVLIIPTALWDTVKFFTDEHLEFVSVSAAAYAITAWVYDDTSSLPPASPPHFIPPRKWRSAEEYLRFKQRAQYGTDQPSSSAYERNRATKVINAWNDVSHHTLITCQESAAELVSSGAFASVPALKAQWKRDSDGKEMSRRAFIQTIWPVVAQQYFNRFGAVLPLTMPSNEPDPVAK